MPAPARQRLFFALLPPPAVHARIAEAAALLATRFAPGGRAIAPEQWHLTLRFLGDFPAGSDATERARWAGAQVRAAPCALVLDQAASFPGLRPPWVLRGADARLSLEGLHGGLCAALAAAGFPAGEPEHAFAPHVTLFRHAAQALPPMPIAPIAWAVRDFVLLESLPAEHRYVELARWPLRPA